VWTLWGNTEGRRGRGIYSGVDIQTALLNTIEGILHPSMYRGEAALLDILRGESTCNRYRILIRNGRGDHC